MLDLITSWDYHHQNYGKGPFGEHCKQKKDGDGKGKEKDSAYVTGSDEYDVLILSLAGSNESWVIDSGASFHATSRHELFQNYVREDFKKVYLGDNEPCNIIGKGDVIVSLSIAQR